MKSDDYHIKRWAFLLYSVLQIVDGLIGLATFAYWRPDWATEWILGHWERVMNWGNNGT